VLAFPLAQAQAHLEQHQFSMKQILHMLVFSLAQAYGHLEQHHSTIKEI
jgi:hypothetical protein